MEFKPTRLSRSMGVVTNLLLVFAILCLVTLPWTVRWFLAYRAGTIAYEPLYLPMLIVLLLSGLCAVGILWQARCVFQTINRGNPFVAGNARRLKSAGWLCIAISVIYLGAIFFIHPSLVLVPVAFFFLACFLFILADLFGQALQYKEENELTI